MEKDRLISIILPVYNGEEYLAKSIESCLNQSYKNIELIIVNDCSLDGSQEIAENYQRQDDRVIILNNVENKGLPSTLNIGHNYAKGAFLTWTSDDNLMKMDCLQSLFDSLIKEEADIVFSNYDVIDSTDKIIRQHQAGPIEHLLFGNKVGASFLYKKEVYHQLNGYNPALFLLEDYDFWLRACRKFKFYHLCESLYLYRIHTNSLTAKIDEEQEFNQQHISKIEQMFENIAAMCHWNQSTKNIVNNNFKGKEIDVLDYLKNSTNIFKEIESYFGNSYNSGEIKKGLLQVMRRQLISNKKNHNFSILFKVLFKEWSLLFHSDFSKKATFNYIKSVLS